MRLDSARDLKKSLLGRVLVPVGSARRVRAVAAGPRVKHGGTAWRIVTLGIAQKGKADFSLAVRVQNRAVENSEFMDTIRQEACGEVDCRYVGRVFKHTALWQREGTRPLRPGSSIGHAKVGAGTLGCFAQAGEDAVGVPLILSCNHVLANENEARKGDAILQPAALDGGAAPGDMVARLSKFVRLKQTRVNKVDCAVAALEPSVEFDDNRLFRLGRLRGLGDALPDGSVAKLGRTTGVTRGRITAFELDNVVVSFRMGKLRFDDQIEIEGVQDGPFSEAGDSGSIVVDADTQGIGLLFAGSSSGGSNACGLSYANPLKSVLEALDVVLWK